MRRDGAENRQRLIEAAREIMREQDGDVALETIAERAGVSRATVYRNFCDRMQLYGAVLQADLALLEAELRQADRCSELPEVMRRVVELIAVYDRFRGCLPPMADFHDDDGCQKAAMLRLMAEPMRRAREAGLLRADASDDDVLLACRMVATGWQFDFEPDRDTALAKRLALVLRGLATSKCN